MIDVDEEVDSDSSKNGKRSRNSAHSTESQAGGNTSLVPPGVIGKRRRTNNSDETENQESNSEKSQDREESTTDCLEKVSFLAPLIKVAASMNPQQFELPPELVEPIPFPGNVIGNFLKIFSISNKMPFDTLRFQQSVQQKNRLGATQKDPRIRQRISTIASTDLLLLPEVSIT